MHVHVLPIATSSPQLIQSDAEVTEVNVGDEAAPLQRPVTKTAAQRAALSVDSRMKQRGNYIWEDF